jgi:hypothetical protein
MMEMVVVRPMMRVVVANGHDGERKMRKFMVAVKAGRKLIFDDFWT